MSLFYFILWVVVILAAIISVPVINAMENKRRREHLGPAEAEAEEEFGEAEFAEEPDADFGDPIDQDPEEPIEVSGGDDFSAFDDEFK